MVQFSKVLRLCWIQDLIFKEEQQDSKQNNLDFISFDLKFKIKFKMLLNSIFLQYIYVYLFGWSIIYVLKPLGTSAFQICWCKVH